MEMMTNPTRRNLSGVYIFDVLPGDERRKPTCFEDCTEEDFDRLIKTLSDVDLTKVIELQDNTNLSGEAACAGGACEIV